MRESEKRRDSNNHKPSSKRNSINNRKTKTNELHIRDSISNMMNSSLYKEPFGFFENNLESKLKASNINYAGISGKPKPRLQNIFKRINR